MKVLLLAKECSHTFQSSLFRNKANELFLELLKFEFNDREY